MQQIPQGLQPLNQLMPAPAAYAQAPETSLPPQAPVAYGQDQGQWQPQMQGGIPATYDPSKYQQQYQQPVQYQQQPVQYQ